MKKKKTQKRTEEEKEVFCRLPDSMAMLTFSFVFFSPSRVESQNPRTTVMKKLTRQQGEQWLWKLKQKEKNSREGAGTGETFTAEQSAQNTQTTRFMQETEGISGYYVVDHNV